MRLRECRELLDKLRAAASARAWGYPREISGEEAEGSVWLRYGSAVVVWFMIDTECEVGEVRVHFCVEPSSRRRVYGRELLSAVYVVAQLLPLDSPALQLRALPCGPQAEEVTGYLRRMGWQEDARGFFRALPPCHEAM